MSNIESSASIEEKAGTLVIEGGEIWFYNPCPSHKGGDTYAVRIPTFRDCSTGEFLNDLRKAIDDNDQHEYRRTRQYSKRLKERVRKILGILEDDHERRQHHHCHVGRL